jgi:hypothetical protein
VLIAVTVVAVTKASAHSNHPDSPRATPDPSTTTTASSDSTAVVPLRTKLVNYMAHRDGANAVAVYDNVSKKLLVVHPGYRGRTASIVKADILETRLHQTGGHLPGGERSTATSMIEASDNDSATQLWDDDGGAPGVSSYNTALGLKQTRADADWGDTTTSASDQVTLVRELLHRNTLLTNKSRHFQRHLMRNVEADQRWGIGSGLPKDVTFGNKNGWLPVDEDHDRWAVNSIGWVRGEGKSYEIAVLTQHNATEGYGKHTIAHIAKLVWNHAEVDRSASP